jgi:hypothetical protein
MNLHERRSKLEFLELEFRRWHSRRECLEAACESLRQEIENEREAIRNIVERAQQEVPLKEFDFDFYDDVSNAAVIRSEYGSGVLVAECFRPYVNFGAA